jgi:hypothetical protein
VRRDLFGAKLERADNERVIALRDKMHFGTSLKRGRSAGRKLSWRHEQFRPSAGRDRGLPFGASQREGKARDKTFPRFGPLNPLKSIDSDERIQGNPTLIIERLRIETATSQENPNRPDERPVRRREAAKPTRSKGYAPSRAQVKTVRFGYIVLIHSVAEKRTQVLEKIAPRAKLNTSVGG